MDPIVDLADDERGGCAVRASGHVDCWNAGGIAERVPDIADALKVRTRTEDFERCIVRRHEITCIEEQGSGGEHGPWSVWQERQHVPIAGALDVVVAWPLCAVRADHRVSCWDPMDDRPRLQPGLRDVVALASNLWDVCAVTASGRELCTRADDDPLVWRATGVDHLRRLAMTRGFINPPHRVDYHGSCTLREDGISCSSYDEDDHRRIAIAQLQGVRDIAMSGPGTLTVLAGGKVVVIARDGREYPVPRLEDAVAISPHCALRAQGSVVCWGVKEIDHELRAEAHEREDGWAALEVAAPAGVAGLR